MVLSDITDKRRSFVVLDFLRVSVSFCFLFLSFFASVNPSFSPHRFALNFVLYLFIYFEKTTTIAGEIT